jgi:hypothetical protein
VIIKRYFVFPLIHKAILMNIFEDIKKIFYPKTSYPLILVTGAPKTGTTAVYHSIREQLPPGSVCLFEPENRDLELPDIISSPVLVKSFVPVSAKYDYFNKKILITRDPRDNIISRVLYAPYNICRNKQNINPYKVDGLIADFQDLLEKKEKAPATVPFNEIYSLIGEFVPLHTYQALLDYYSNHRDNFILRYEDYVDGNLGALNHYLRLDLKVVDKVPEKRVVRSKAYGNWKDWFTAEDIEFFHKIFEPYMAMFGYKDDWTLNEEQKIDPAHGSVYVSNLIKEAIS